MIQFFDLDPATRPVRLSTRPAGTHPYDFDAGAVRIVRADQVKAGDVVLGEVYGHTPGGRAAGVGYLPYGCAPYSATPRPLDRRCPCEMCHEVVADPFTYLTEPVVLTVWQRDGLDPVCQINNADELLVVVPRWAVHDGGFAPERHYCREHIERAANSAFDRLSAYFDFDRTHDRRLFTGAVLAFLDDANTPFPFSSHSVDDES
ncbi:hypothetical protein [Streptomyces sp. bgisy060]|uniref:hypothetical protein n=1 Tax=Streptomyces sp. bgisy060 TaxID=3413775 RepID=UPI003EB9CE29